MFVLVKFLGSHDAFWLDLLAIYVDLDLNLDGGPTAGLNLE